MTRLDWTLSPMWWDCNVEVSSNCMYIESMRSSLVDFQFSIEFSTLFTLHGVVSSQLTFHSVCM